MAPGVRMAFLFFLSGSTGQDPGPLPAGLRVVVWRPSLLRPLGTGVPAMPFAVWGVYHLLGRFGSPDYQVLSLWAEDGVVNRSCLLPAHAKFPFMAREDLQAAGLWTRPDQRGRGVALAGLQTLLARVPDRRIWYMVHEDNAASIRLAEKAGFHFHARGRKTGRGPFSPYALD